MIVKQAFFISAQKIITATVGASFSVSIMLILTWRCNYINYSTMRISTTSRLYIGLTVHLCVFSIIAQILTRV